jgi:hypothetical protein
MDTIKPVAAPSDIEAGECKSLSGRTAVDHMELRALSDYELWFVGGGDGIPEWGH